MADVQTHTHTPHMRVHTHTHTHTNTHIHTCIHAYKHMHTIFTVLQTHGLFIREHLALILIYIHTYMLSTEVIDQSTPSIATRNSF